MSSFVQWVHLIAAAVGVGGMAFLAAILLPSLHIVEPAQRELILKRVIGRFRWVSWILVPLLMSSGLYNVRQYYWEVRWGGHWELLVTKIVLSGIMFSIVLALTLPFRVFDWFRARRERWLAAALALGFIIFFISALLRRT